jgi:hypothetical protein
VRCTLTQGDDALKSAVRLLPIVFTLVFGCVGGGVALAKVGYYSPFYIVGSGMAMIGAILLHLVDVDTKAANIYGYTILVGLGCGMFVQAGFSIAPVKVPKDQLAAVTGFIALGQLLGPLITLSIAGTVLINVASSGLQDLFPDVPATTIKNAIAGTAGSFFSTLSQDQKDAALHVIVGAINRVYILTIIGGVMAFVLSLLLRHERIVVDPASGGSA